MKKAIVTALFNSGNKKTDQVGKITKPIPGFDYFLFTYKNHTALYEGYNVIHVDKVYDSDVKMAKYVKWQTHKLLPEYDIVIWTDAFITPSYSKMREIDSIVQNILLREAPIALLRHHTTKTIKSEVAYCTKLKKINQTMGNSVLEYLDKEKYVDKEVFWTCMVIKNNKDETLKLCSETLMKLLDTICYRDQVWIPYVFSVFQMKPIIIDRSYFTSNGKVTNHVYT